MYLKSTANPKDAGRQDCFAFVGQMGEIVYVPELFK